MSIHPCLRSSEALTGPLRPQLCGAESQGRHAEGSCRAVGARLQLAFVLVVWSSDLPACCRSSWVDPLHQMVPIQMSPLILTRPSSVADRWLQVLPRPCGLSVCSKACVSLSVLVCECEKAWGAARYPYPAPQSLGLEALTHTSNPMYAGNKAHCTVPVPRCCGWTQWTQ